MNETFFTTDRNIDLLLLVVLYAALFPAVTYLTFRLRGKYQETLFMIELLHVEVRELFRLNKLNVLRFKEKGIKLPLASKTFIYPLLRDDAKRTGVEIADDASKKEEQDHVEQLKRIVEELSEIAQNDKNFGFLTGLNIAVLLISIVLIFAGIITSPTGIGLLLCVLGFIVLILDLIAKMLQNELETRNRRRAERIKKEVEAKKQKLEEKVV
jgi:hypothetical protein